MTKIIPISFELAKLFAINDYYVVDWIEVPNELAEEMSQACIDGYVESFIETESYMFTEKFTSLFDGSEDKFLEWINSND